MNAATNLGRNDASSIQSTVSYRVRVMISAVAAVLCIFLLPLSLAAKGGNGKGNGGGNNGDGDPPALPDGRYAITWLDSGEGWTVRPYDMNELGEIVGTRPGPESGLRAVAYCPLTCVAFDLNDLGADWWDLNAASPTIATGWTAWAAVGLNEFGDIVGLADHPNEFQRAFVLRDAFGLNPQFLLLPTVGNFRHEGTKINNDGEAVAGCELGVVRYTPTSSGAWPHYHAILEPMPYDSAWLHINDAGAILSLDFGGVGGKPMSYLQLTSGNAPQVFDGFILQGLSNTHTCGTRTRTKGKNGQPTASIRLDVGASAGNEDVLLEGDYWTRAINDDGDTCIEVSGRGVVYHGAFGALPLDDLVDSQDPDWLDTSSWIRLVGINNSNPVSDPDETGLGQICGVANASGRGFVLTPYMPPAP